MSTFIPPPLEKPLLYNEPVFHSISPWKNSLINDLNFELNNKGQGIPDDFDYDGNEIDEFVNNLPEIISNQEKKNPSLGSAEEEDCVTLKKKKYLSSMRGKTAIPKMINSQLARTTKKYPKKRSKADTKKNISLKGSMNKK